MSKKKQTVGDFVYETLRMRLTSNYYYPGEQLKEEILAKDLNVSRTPVRAGLLRLISEGLLIESETRGALVTEWTKQDSQEVFQIRIELEGLCAQLAATNANQSQRDDLKSLGTKMDRTLKLSLKEARKEFHNLNYQFHLLIMQSANNSRLMTMTKNLFEIPNVLGGYYIYSEADIIGSTTQHLEILNAILANNSKWARAAMTCHLSAAANKHLLI